MAATQFHMLAAAVGAPMGRRLSGGQRIGPYELRFVYRSLDGGEHWSRVLWRNPDTGAMDVLLAPDDPRTVYAALWSARQPPWEGGGGSLVRSEDDGLWKSTDGGDTFRTMDAHQAQEIREAYYKAIEGLRTLADALEIAAENNREYQRQKEQAAAGMETCKINITKEKQTS